MNPCGFCCETEQDIFGEEWDNTSVIHILINCKGHSSYMHYLVWGLLVLFLGSYYSEWWYTVSHCSGLLFWSVIPLISMTLHDINFFIMMNMFFRQINQFDFTATSYCLSCHLSISITQQKCWWTRYAASRIMWHL